MRRHPIAIRLALIAGLSIMAAGTFAQGSYNAPPNNNVNGGPQKFGSITCREKIPCASGTAYFSASDLAASANSCIQQGLGMSLADGFFDQSAGLDSSGCLTVRAELLAQKNGKTILPKCCEITLSDDTSCAFHCDLINGW